MPNDKNRKKQQQDTERKDAGQGEQEDRRADQQNDDVTYQPESGQPGDSR